METSARYLPAACVWATLDPGGNLHTHYLERLFSLPPGLAQALHHERAVKAKIDPEHLGGLFLRVPLTGVGFALYYVRDQKPLPPANEVAETLFRWLSGAGPAPTGTVAIVGPWEPSRQTYGSLNRKRLRTLRHFLRKARGEVETANVTRSVRANFARVLWTPLARSR